MWQQFLYIIDDDDAIRDALSIMGDMLGLKTMAYGSAEDFLDAYDPSRPGPLILDLQMPGMHGLQLQQELAMRGLRIPIIIVTAQAEGWESERAIAAGARAVLEKPFDMQLLIGHIKQAIAQLEADVSYRSCALMDIT